MKPSELFDLNEKSRNDILEHVIEAVEQFINEVHQLEVTPELDMKKVRSLFDSIKFKKPFDPREAIDFVLQGFSKYQMKVSHPMYFGLFNPSPTTMGITGDVLVAAFNPNLGSWSHSPFAIEVEQHLLKTFGTQFGYDLNNIDGTFTTGGAEANFTAILTALTYTFPKFKHNGLRGLDRQPILYISKESHHSFIRAASWCGLGTEWLRQIPVDDNLQIDLEILEKQIKQDKNEGFAPFLIIGNVGSTNSGVVDPIDQLASVSSREKIWFHVDAAWGGAAAFLPEFQSYLKGIEQSDSITFDAHKWLSVPMGAGIYLTRHKGILDQTFNIKADYMPKNVENIDVINPYRHSIQCSRRFIGLKVFLSFIVAGLEGYTTVIRHQVAMGDLLRKKLTQSGWKVVNKTKLPIACFMNNRDITMKSDLFLEKVVEKITSSGKTWVSTTLLNENLPVIRVCITNYRTEPEHIQTLVKLLNEARADILSPDL